MATDPSDLALVIHLLTLLHKRSLSDSSAVASARQMLLVPEIQHLLRILQAWTWETDSDGKFIFVSPEFPEITSLPTAQFLGKTRIEIMTAQQPISFSEVGAHRRTLTSKIAFRNFQYSVRAPNGHIHWFSTSGWPVLSTNGSFRGYVGLGTEITKDRREMADAIEQNVYLGDAMNAISISVLILNEDQNILYHNARWRALHEAMDPKDYAPGESYDRYLRAAIAARLFPEADQAEEDFIQRRIYRNLHPEPRQSFLVKRQNGIILSITVTKISAGTNTAIISTELAMPNIDADS